METSIITTRSRARKLINANECVTETVEKTKQLRKKEKFTDIKQSSKAAIKKVAKGQVAKNVPSMKEVTKNVSPNTRVICSPSSSKKKTSHHKRKLFNERRSDNKDEINENESMDLNQPNKLLKNKQSDDVIRKDLSMFQLNNSGNLDSNNTPKQRKVSIKNVKISNSIVTPESTPIKLNLTPHRSTKTPKKSPVSLSSPKTYSPTLSRLSRTSRKLSLNNSNDESMNKSNVDLDSKKSQDKCLHKGKKHNLNDISLSDKSLSTSSSVKTKQDKSNMNLKEIVHRFSKSPKIVLKSLKSKKSRSRNKKLASPLKIQKSPSKTCSTSALVSTPDYNTINISTKSVSSGKPELLNSKISKVLTALQIKDILTEPIVLLEDISSERIKSSPKAIGENQSATSIRVNNLKISKSATRKSVESVPTVSIEDITNSNKLMNNEKSAANRLSQGTKHDTSLQRKSTTFIISSTPQREEELLPLPKKDFNDINQTNISDISKQSITYDDENIDAVLKKEKENKKNDTYELKEPQTSKLQELIRKNTGADLSAKKEKEEDLKESCNVHIRNVTLREKRNSVHRPISNPTIPRMISLHNENAQKDITDTPYKSKKIDTPKSSQNSVVSSFKAKSSPMLNKAASETQLNRKRLQNNKIMSVIPINRVQSTPKMCIPIEQKSEKKSSIKRKVPNFEKIHEKLFAKSESVIDAKKRLKDRHLAFISMRTPKADTKNEVKPLPSDSRNGTHNRFGFRLRKPEATHVMLTKQTVYSKQKNQTEMRMMLKGVRMNRRFELQMKSRNINI